MGLKKFKKYVFELVVIFTGITLSFIVDEFRTSRRENNDKDANLIFLKSDIEFQLTQYKKFGPINRATKHDLYFKFVEQKIRSIDSLSMLFARLELDRGSRIPNYKNWEYFTNGEKLGQLENKEISRLLDVIATVKNGITNIDDENNRIVKSEIYPILHGHGILTELIEVRGKEIDFEDSTSFDYTHKNKTTPNLRDIYSDNELAKWTAVCFKMYLDEEVYFSILLRRYSELKNEIDKELN